jgi:cyanophycin synthetase
MKHIPKIAVTGTKGKTTVVNVMAEALRQFEYDTLKVDTTGHYVNGEQRSTLDDSKTIWNLVPTVSPGRYLWEFKTDPKLSESDRPAAVLEAALGSSAGAGVGYRHHEVGVFLNVLEDHLGSSARLQTKEDIARAKNFVFKRVRQDGYVVFNAEDKLVVGQLQTVPTDRNATLVACGVDLSEFDVAAHLASGGVIVTTRDNWAILQTKAGERQLFDLTAIPWTFKATFMPSVYNLLHAAGALHGFFEGRLPATFQSVMEGIRLDQYGGRLTLLQAANGATILADYAHEKVSLAFVGDLARQLAKPGGRVIGVVRLAYDRTPELIEETGIAIADHYDQFVVYDKIDGHFTQGEQRAGKRFQKIVGQVSAEFSEAIASRNPSVERILREDEAIAKAAELAGPNDCVVIIVNDDIRRSIGFIQDSFQARFL